MAGEVDDIVQNVVLTGNAQVAEAFNKIQEAGTRAFEAIEKAGEHLGSFTGLATVLGGLAASIAIVGVGLFAFTKETAESVSSMSDLASQAGTTMEEVSGLRAAFAAGGVGAGEMESAFRHLAITTQTSWAEIKQASREGSDKLRGDAISVSQAELALGDAQQKLANIDRDQASQRKSNANSVAEARLRLAELNGQDVTDQRQALTLSQARLAVDQARAKQRDDAANADAERKKVANAAELAEISLSQAKKKQQDDTKNDISNIIDATRKLVDGDKQALQSINPSVDNLVKGIVGAAKEGGESLNGLRGDITDLSSPAPTAKAALDTLSKALSNMDDNAQKMAVAARFLGRTLTQDFLNVLSDPKKLEEFQERIDHLGLALNAVDKQVADKFREALFTLQNDIGLVADKLGTALGPGFTKILEAIDDALVRNKDAIIQFASDIANKAIPIIESFIRVLSGAPDAAKDQWLIDYTTKAKQLADTLGTVASSILGIIRAISSVASGIANSLNAVLGTHLNGFDVIFGALLAKAAFTFFSVQAAAVAAWAGIGQAAKVGAAEAGAAAAESAAAAGVASEAAVASTGVLLLRFGLVIATIYTVVKAWQAFQDAVGGDGKSSQWDAMADGALKKLNAIKDAITTGDLKKGWDDFWAADEEQKTKFKELDDIDSQIAANKKRREQELAGTSKDIGQQIQDDAKVALDQQDADHKASIDRRIADEKRLKDAAHQTSEQTKNDNADAAKAAQTEHTSTTSQSQPVSSTAARTTTSTPSTSAPAPQSAPTPPPSPQNPVPVIIEPKPGQRTAQTKPIPGGVVDENGTPIYGSSTGYTAETQQTMGQAWALGAQEYAKKRGVPVSDVVGNVANQTGSSATGVHDFEYSLFSEGHAGTFQFGMNPYAQSLLGGPTSNSGAAVIHPPGPNSPEYKQQEDTQAKAVQRGMEARDQKLGVKAEDKVNKSPSEISRTGQVLDNQLFNDAGFPTTSVRTPDEMKAVESALEAFKTFGGQLDAFSKIDPANAGLLRSLSDRSDGSVAKQRAGSLDGLERMLQNQSNLSGVEGTQGQAFAKSLAEQVGQEFQKVDRKTGLPQSANYAPPVPGHYNENMSFVPSNPNDVAYDSAGRPYLKKAPPGYNPNQPTPTSFPGYVNSERDRLSNPPLPVSDPRKGSQAYTDLEDTQAKAVQRGMEERDRKLLGGFSQARNGVGPTEIPTGAGLENLPVQPAPEQFKSFGPLAPLVDRLPSIFDFLNKAFTDPGALQKPFTADSTFQTERTQPSPPIQPLTDTAAQAGDVIKPPAPDVTTPLESFFQEVTSLLDQLQEKIKGPADNTVTTPTDSLGIRGDAGQEIETASTSVATSIESGGQSIADALSNAATSISNANTTSSSGGATQAGTVSAAGGGHIWGPGTETSDSIAAWLSRNEFVQPAHAVRHYGVEFMENVRHLRLPKFNTGGLVGLLSPSLPRYSVGGSVTASRTEVPPVPVDLRTDHGTVRVQAPKSAINQLQRAAATKRLTSTTKRRPEFVG